MGTLFDQPIRENKTIEYDEVNHFLKNIVEKLVIDSGFSKDQVLKSFEILELKRKNDLYRMNGDIHDEQMAGIGELLQNLNNNIEILISKFDSDEV